MLHIDYVVEGLLCKLMEEKDGLAGLKRALAYKSIDDLLRTEFGMTAKTTNAFFRKKFEVLAGQ
jgi:hypothetical protein